MGYRYTSHYPKADVDTLRGHLDEAIAYDMPQVIINWRRALLRAAIKVQQRQANERRV